MTYDLQPRHGEIAAMVWEGMKPAEIADKLGVNRQVLSWYLFKHKLDPITRNWGWVLENHQKMSLLAMEKELGVGSTSIKKRLAERHNKPKQGTPKGAINLALHSKWS